MVQESIVNKWTYSHDWKEHDLDNWELHRHKELALCRAGCYSFFFLSLFEVIRLKVYDRICLIVVAKHPALCCDTEIVPRCVSLNITRWSVRNISNKKIYIYFDTHVKKRSPRQDLWESVLHTGPDAVTRSIWFWFLRVTWCFFIALRRMLLSHEWEKMKERSQNRLLVFTDVVCWSPY